MREEKIIYVPVLLIDNRQCSYSIAMQDFIEVNRKDTLGMAVGFSGLQCACTSLNGALNFIRKHILEDKKDLIHNRYYKSEISIRVYKFIVYVYNSGLLETYRIGHYSYEITPADPIVLNICIESEEYISVQAGEEIDENL